MLKIEENDTRKAELKSTAGGVVLSSWKRETKRDPWVERYCGRFYVKLTSAMIEFHQALEES